MDRRGLRLSSGCHYKRTFPSFAITDSPATARLSFVVPVTPVESGLKPNYGHTKDRGEPHEPNAG